MKKVYFWTKDFLVHNFKISCFVMANLVLIGSISIIYARTKFFAILTFIFALTAIYRLTVYKIGKIPFLVKDTTWNRYRFKYSKEEALLKYKGMSIARATLYFLFAILSLFLWVVCEIVVVV